MSFLIRTLRKTTIGRLYVNSLIGLPPQVWLLALIMLINRTGAMVIPFLSIYMNKELGFSLTQVGWVMGSFGLGSFLGNYIGGRLVDKYGQYYQQIFSLVATGTTFFALSFFTGFVPLMIGVFVVSLMADLFRPANLAAMSIYSNEDQITRSISLNRLAMNLGFTVGPGIAGWLALKYGYKIIFYVDAVSCYIAALVFFVFLKRREIVRDKKKAEELKGAVLARDPWFGFLLVVVFFSGVGFISLFTSYPVYMESVLGMNEARIGSFLALNGFLVFLLEMPIVYYLEKKKQQMIPIIVGIALIGLALVSNSMPFDVTIIVATYIVLITLGEIFAFPFQATFILQRASNEEKGTYMGYYGLTFSLAIMSGPAFSFWFADKFNFYWLWILLGAITLLSCLTLFVFRKKLDQHKKCP